MQRKLLMSKVIFLSVLSGFFMSSVRADQCQLISAEQAAKSLDFLKPNSKIVEFCEPCGDKDFYTRTPQAIVDVQAKAEDDYWAVYVNGKNIDLAYTFVANAQGDFLNVSKLANCPSDDVSMGFAASATAK